MIAAEWMALLFVEDCLWFLSGTPYWVWHVSYYYSSQMLSQYSNSYLI